MIGVGVMSGSSLDGIDVVVSIIDNHSYQLLNTYTISLPTELYHQLKNAIHANIEEVLSLEFIYSKWIAEELAVIIKNRNVDFIAIHGHTLLHLPTKGISRQLANGGVISAKTKVKTITDFRIADVALNGVGTPLVPFFEKTYLSDYHYFLNLGGIANLSMSKNWKAFDVCPCNQILNYLSNKLNKPFDKNGQLASKGSFSSDIFDSLMKATMLYPHNKKALDNTELQNYYFSLLDTFVEPIESIIHTSCIWITEQIVSHCRDQGQLLVSGGGVYNTFLLDMLRKKLEEKQIQLVVPSEHMINFKEALLMVALGYYRITNQINIISSVTGADIDSIGGAIYNVYGT